MTTNEEQLRQRIRHVIRDGEIPISEDGELDIVMQLIKAYGDSRELEGRIDENKYTTDLYTTDWETWEFKAHIASRRAELTNLKETKRKGNDE